MQVDAAKAPGYRGTTVCSPVSSKSSTTPPSLSGLASYSSYSPPTQSPAQYSRVYSEYPPDQPDTYHYTQVPPPAVTSSRLNPRAPDFSTRAPTSSQQPVYSPPTAYMQPAPAVLSFPLNKFPPQQRPNGQTQPQRWHHVPPPHAFAQPEMVGFTNAHLATLAALSHPGMGVDTMLGSLENGAVGSSPSSPQHCELRPLDDRKVRTMCNMLNLEGWGESLH